MYSRLFAGTCLLLALLNSVSGCAASAPRSNLTYGDRARREYEEAMELFNGGDFAAATERFQQIRRQYQLSRWAWLAELRIADGEFRQENFSQAISAYRNWIRYHPTQPEVPYAHFMIARSYYGQIPQESIVSVAPWDRDQGSTRDAETYLARFIREYPDAREVTEARDYLRRTRELLARAEIHIADYYLSRNHVDAGVARLREVLDQYAGSGLEPEALLRLGELYLRTERPIEARESFQRILSDFPRAAQAPAAQRYLGFLRAGR